MRKRIALSAAALLMAAACASQPRAKPWDKEGVRQRSGETGKKLGKEEVQH